MKHSMIKSLCLVAAVLSFSSVGTWAAPQTVTLEIPTMNCAACPITIKKALERVDGVSTANVSYETRLAKVTFDDAKTNPKALVAATTNAGYPSTTKEQ